MDDSKDDPKANLLSEAASPYHHGDLRAALLAAAPALIVEQGLDAFTLRELARRVSVSHTAAYRHFADKNDLLAAIALEGHRRFAQTLERTGEEDRGGDGDGDLSGVLSTLAAAYFTWACDNEGAYRVMFGPRLNAEGDRPALESAIGRSFAVVENVLIRRGFPSGQARNLSVSLLTQMHGFFELYRLRRIRVEGRRGALAYLSTHLQPLIAGALAMRDIP